MNVQILAENCKGPNRACRSAHKQGRPVHMIPGHKSLEPALVLPSYHFESVEAGRVAIADAIRSAPTVYGDADLFEYREREIPFFLPVGWVDPSRRAA